MNKSRLSPKGKALSKIAGGGFLFTASAATLAGYLGFFNVPQGDEIASEVLTGLREDASYHATETINPEAPGANLRSLCGQIEQSFNEQIESTGAQSRLVGRYEQPESYRPEGECSLYIIPNGQAKWFDGMNVATINELSDIKYASDVQELRTKIFAELPASDIAALNGNPPPAPETPKPEPAAETVPAPEVVDAPAPPQPPAAPAEKPEPAPPPQNQSQLAIENQISNRIAKLAEEQRRHNTLSQRCDSLAPIINPILKDAGLAWNIATNLQKSEDTAEKDGAETCAVTFNSTANNQSGKWNFYYRDVASTADTPPEFTILDIFTNNMNMEELPKLREALPRLIEGLKLQ